MPMKRMQDICLRSELFGLVCVIAAVSTANGQTRFDVQNFNLTANATTVLIDGQSMNTGQLTFNQDSPSTNGLMSDWSQSSGTVSFSVGVILSSTLLTQLSPTPFTGTLAFDLNWTKDVDGNLNATEQAAGSGIFQNGSGAQLLVFWGTITIQWGSGNNCCIGDSSNEMFVSGQPNHNVSVTWNSFGGATSIHPINTGSFRSVNTVCDPIDTSGACEGGD